MRAVAAIVAIMTMLVSPASTASAQQSFQAAPRIFVTTLPQDPQQVPAGKSVVVDLKFRVSNGMHVNSHKPTEDYLIPTALTLADAAGIEWGAVEYPAGELRTFAFSSTEKLNVYTGDITLHVHLTARPGQHIATATLRYQACDNRACYPPKSLPVKLVIEAR